MITVIILTRNESRHISRAIKSVEGFANRVVVVDSFSSDDTVDIAKSLGADVFSHYFLNQSQQFNWALDNVGVETEWVMRLDADEIIESDLAKKIDMELFNLPPSVVGVNLKRKHIFMNRWIRHGGRYPLKLLRIWRHGCGRVEDRWMDEHVAVFGGEVVTFDGGFADHNLNDLTFFIDKHNRYATREAIEILNWKLNLFPRKEILQSTSSLSQASIKRFIKNKIYNRIPFGFSALLYFLFRYIFQLGFLDGRSGVIYHFLQGYWYRFLVGAKIIEMETAIKGMKDKEKIIAEISRLTGYDLLAR